MNFSEWNPRGGLKVSNSLISVTAQSHAELRLSVSCRDSRCPDNQSACDGQSDETPLAHVRSHDVCTLLAIRIFLCNCVLGNNMPVGCGVHLGCVIVCWPVYCDGMWHPSVPSLCICLCVCFIWNQHLFRLHVHVHSRQKKLLIREVSLWSVCVFVSVFSSLQDLW